LLNDPIALAIVGEPGIGKTTLWMHAVASARARASVVLVARPAESEARLSFAGLTDLLSTVPVAVLAAIPAPQRAALDVALLRAPARRVPERRLVGTALLSLLRSLSGEAEIVIAIDDLHWLDAPSAAALEFALRRIAGAPVRAILSVRESEAERPLLASLDREQQVQRLELGPLSVASLHRVLAQELGHSFPRPNLVRIATASNGNPLYALEIARLLDRRDDGDGIELPVPVIKTAEAASRTAGPSAS
jgi:AAA ATPase domain